MKLHSGDISHDVSSNEPEASLETSPTYTWEQFSKNM